MYLSFELFALVLAMAVFAVLARRNWRAGALATFAFLAFGVTLFFGPPTKDHAYAQAWDGQFVPVQGRGTPAAAKPEVKVEQVTRKAIRVRSYPPIDAKTLAETRRILEEWSAPEVVNRNNQADALAAYERANYAAFAIRSTAQRYFPGESRYIQMANRKRAEALRIWSIATAGLPERATNLRP